MTLKGDTTGAAPGASYGAAAAAEPVGQVGSAPVRQTWSFFNNSALGGLSRNASSEVLTKSYTKLGDFLKANPLDKPFEASLIQIDNSKETALHLSGIVVAVKVQEAGDLGVSYYTLLLEGSNEPLQPKIDNSWNNQPVTVDRVSGDVLNAKYASVVHDIVKRSFPTLNCRSNSGMVVPRTFNWEDTDGVRMLIANAVYPAITDLEAHHPSFEDINLANWAKDSILQVQLNFNEPDRLDYAGLPVRNAIAITLTAVDNSNKNNRDINVDERTKLVSRLGGFIDLIWAPEPTLQNNPYAVGIQGPQWKFSPRFVMTNLENVLRMTTPSQLLALVTALPLSESNNWFPYFQPRQHNSGNKVDLRDIGAINFEANIYNEPSGFGSRIETKAASYTTLDLGRLLGAAIRPFLNYSLDVSECGADTWYNEIFAAAAAGIVSAQNGILEAANKLTGGRFAANYPSNESPVIVNEDRIHLGYYIGADGQKHDIREIDYLAVLNTTGETDPAAAQAWSDTFLRTEYPLNLRLMKRKEMIINLARADITFTGFARRVTFTGKFLEALLKSCKEAGLETRVTSPSFGGEYTNQRASATYLPQSAVQPLAAGSFGNSFGSQPAAGFGVGGFGQRWQ